MDIFASVVLEPAQEELLSILVEAARSLPRDRRERFNFSRSLSGDFIIHPGLPGSSIPSYLTDINVLAAEGLIDIDWRSEYSANFDITPLGFKFYAWLKKRAGAPLEHVESYVRQFLEHTCAQKYPEAYQKWSDAEAMLWGSDSSRSHTMVGHLCREAVQTFVTALIEKLAPPEVDSNPAHTVARMRAVLEALKPPLGDARFAFVEALLAYWGATMDLIQRQEHGAQKEGEPLSWIDSRRVVFNTAMLMLEIDNLISEVARS